MTPVLQIAGLSVEARDPGGRWFPTVHAASVNVEPGEVVALIGESGAGKTTLALAALGYVRPGTRITAGSVRVGDSDVLALSPHDRQALRGRRVAYVAQSAAAALNPALTIGDQLAEARRIHRLKEQSDRPAIVTLMSRLNLPDPDALALRYPHQLSGGQQQRVMIAMAMSCAPDLLVLDEPTTALDVTTQVGVLAVLREVLQDDRKAALYVSHNLAVVAQVADRILVMRMGRVVEEGPAEQILYAPRSDYTRALLGAIRPRRQAPRPPYARHVAPVTPLLVVRDIRASYRRPGLFRPGEQPEQNVLRNVSLGIMPGEVVALVGESGSGKSTLARVIAGLHVPLSGSIELAGETLPPDVRRRRLRQLRRIQLITQSPDASLNPSQKVSEVIGRPLQLYSDLRGTAVNRRVDELLALVDLKPTYAGRYSFELSGGEKQRVSIARALAAEPDMLLCDEVLSSLDTIVGAAILDLMRELRDRLRLSYLFISHDLATVTAIADRAVVLYAGQVCEKGPVEQVFTAPHHPYTTVLLHSTPEPRRGWLNEILAGQATVSSTVANMPRDQGCSFRFRCPSRIEGTCDRLQPSGRQDGAEHTIFCHRTLGELAATAHPDGEGGVPQWDRLAR
ncbi:MAG: ABC transporter ATP-binding protein [Dongiaceae bacterium]